MSFHFISCDTLPRGCLDSHYFTIKLNLVSITVSVFELFPNSLLSAVVNIA